MVSSNRKGDRREREFVNRVADADEAVMRAPASGSATERDLPDVFFSAGVFYAGELKTSAGDPIYIDKEEVRALRWFADKFGAKAVIGVRWDGDTTWYLYDPDNLHETEKAYRVKSEDRADADYVLRDLLK